MSQASCHIVLEHHEPSRSIHLVDEHPNMCRMVCETGEALLNVGNALAMRAWLAQWLYKHGVADVEDYEIAAKTAHAVHSHDMSYIKSLNERIEKLTSKTSARRHDIVCAILPSLINSNPDSRQSPEYIAEAAMKYADAVMVKEYAKDDNGTPFKLASMRELFHKVKPYLRRARDNSPTLIDTEVGVILGEIDRLVA